MEQNKKVKTYNNAKVYRIICNETGLQYIGSTCKTLSARLSEHKSDYKRYLDGRKNYVTSYKILENDNFDIVLLENLVNCKSKDELHQKERYYIDNMECVNKVIPGRTKKEYMKKHYQENKEQYKEYNKEHYLQNLKESLQIKSQIVVNCPCGINYKGPNHKTRHERTKKHIDNMAKLEQN